MTIANATETAILKLIFQAVTWADYAVSAGSGTPETNIVVALHTADPGEAGAQNTTEVAYTGYGRVNVARTTGGWTETTGSVSPVAAINFGASSSAGSTAAFFSTGKSAAAPHRSCGRAP